jgi:hypothetical protein
MLTVLYDGWPLAYQPNSPGAIHLLTILDNHPPAARAVVALPAASFHPLPEGISSRIVPALDKDAARLVWEQRTLPRLAGELGARLVHLTSGGPALFSSVTSVISPAAFVARHDSRRMAERGAGIAARLREALGQGGMVRVGSLFWPADLPTPTVNVPVQLLPPAVHPGFSEQGAPVDEPEAQEELRRLLDAAGVELPETYILYHGPGSAAELTRLLDAWSWAAGSIGDYYPLLVAGLDDPARRELDSLLAKYSMARTARVLPILPLAALAALYRGCHVLFHPSPIFLWGDPLRMALACGKPVVCLETPLTEALVRQGGYLIGGDAAAQRINRLLGAALITVVVEDDLAMSLSQAARELAAAWSIDRFARSLGDAYQAILPTEAF